MSHSPITDFLQVRRSVLARNMSAPGPDRATLETLLSIGVRVPDHGKLAPWRLVVIEGDERARLGAVAGEAYRHRHGDEKPELAQAASEQFMRAPCVVAVLAHPVAHPKIPRLEQVLSAGAVCMNLLTAAQSMGFAAQWLTGEAAYESRVAEMLGAEAGDEIVGFIYIGSRTDAPSERPRPALDEVVRFGLDTEQ